jgi:hypothetical protein
MGFSPKHSKMEYKNSLAFAKESGEKDVVKHFL